MSTGTRSHSVDVEGLEPTHYLGIALALLSGVIHLFLGVSYAPSPLGISFLVAGVGFVAGAAGVLLQYRRQLLYRLGIPFTAGQIVLWYVVNFYAGTKSFPADVGAIGAVDKVAQVALVLVLLRLLRET